MEEKTPKIKKFMVTKPISLSFLTPQDQHDLTINPAMGDTWLETDGSTVWLSLKWESITTSNVIDLFLKNKQIEEIP